MIEQLKQLNILLMGGDRREVELWRLWQERGLAVSLVGFEEYPFLPQGKSSAHVKAGDNVVLIAPLSGIKAGCKVKASFAKSKSLKVLPFLERADTPIIILAGSADPELKRQLPDNTRLILTLEDEELQLLNAVPTAEGALQKAMELSPVTLHGSSAVVIGLGRCGAALARSLQGLGAAVAAVVRRRETAALAVNMGLKPYYLDEINGAVESADFVFNTVPAPVLPAAVLEKVPKGALVLDIAQSPGGVNYEAAAELGIQALFLPGLPGKASPLTAARILDQVYSRLIKDELAEIEKIREGEHCRF